ncbi:MAG TPA: TonB-dependent receptor [Rhizomicrobium sp.]|nr:TonB-dependent receptor [Rhizomicrobium sp.]
MASASVLALAPPAAAVESATNIETIIVTANKRAEPIKEVPMAVTALTSDQLSNLKATSFADFVARVPGMTAVASDPSHTSLVLRGITTQGVGATIGTYLDETPYGSSSALANGTITTPNLDTFDVERVEILRGPQGTLYGASTLGGLLKFVTKAPDPSGFAAEAEVGGEDIDHGEAGAFVKAMVNAPLGDNFAVRAVGYYTDEPGFIDDPVLKQKDVNGGHIQGGRVSALWEASAKLKIRATAILQDIDENADYAEDLTTVGNTLVPLFGDLEQGRVANEFSHVRYRLYNATVNYDFDWAQLTSATSYGTFNDKSLQDVTGLYGTFLRPSLGQKKFTQELRLASAPDQTLEWLAGFYYTHENADLFQDLAPIGYLQLTSSFAETAGFANFVYHFSPAFDVSFGGRWSTNSQNADETGLALAGGKSSENVFTWSVAPRWHVNDDTIVYARIAKGYRPGGPNALPPLTTGLPKQFSSDSLINYELGVKTDMLDHRLSLDVDAFYIDWSDIQLLTVVQGFGINGNGGTAVSEGFEWNASWLPVDGLSLRFGGSYTDAHLTSGTDPILVGAKSGDPLPYNPHWSTSLDADYTFDPMGDFTPFLGVSWAYIGERETDFNPGGRYLLPSYDTVDLRAGVNHDRWSLELYAKNVGDERGVSSLGTTIGSAAAVGATAEASVIRPRVVGISLTGKL